MTEDTERRNPGREFFTTKTVSQALEGFRPGRRTRAETVPLEAALRRVTAQPVIAPHSLPGFARSTVDGYAVRAADTYGASDGLPGYLDVTGAVLMGTQPDVTVRPGTAVAMPTGGVIPPGADAVIMVEYTAQPMPGTIEVVRPVAPGEGIVRADEDLKSGEAFLPNATLLRPADLAMLAALGITRVAVRARPRVTIFSTGDEVVPPRTAELRPGQVRDATATALAALVTDAGGEPSQAGIIPDDPGALEKALRGALAGSDMIVISAGSSVGARDETANAVAALGPPGIWCHGLAIKPGKPTLLAECGVGPDGTPGVPVIGLPGNPRSALVVFRLIGMPVIRLVGGCAAAPPEPSARARLARDLASASGRLDVVQVTMRGGVATPVFGASALLSVLTQADGYIVIPEEATGLDAGTEVDVTLYA
jgi:molybdopterin molybdotransferase